MHDAGGHHHYREADVRSATPEKLVVLLYGKLVRDLEEAIAAHQADNHLDSIDRVHHARLIVTELAHALDPNRDSGLADDLASLYEFVLHETALYLAGRDPARLDHCLKVVGPLRTAWTSVVDNLPDAGRETPSAAEDAKEKERPTSLFSVSA